MAEPIKLFGKTIPFPERTDTPAPSSGLVADDDVGGGDKSQHQDQDVPSCLGEDAKKSPDRGGEEMQNEEDKEREDDVDNQHDNGASQPSKPDSNSEIAEDLKTQSSEKGSNEVKSSKAEEPSETANGSQGKTLKKPDKILPCPRCNSMDTKFCYYNNYNVNQPRHFCKNCQRYWTAGGTMRNVPVGAGRRKNKNSVSHQYRHVTVPEALQSPRTDLPSGVHQTNGTVLTFGSDTPLCESMASVLNLADMTIQNHPRNGYIKPGDLKIQIPDQLNGSSNSNSDPDDEVRKGSCQPQNNFPVFPPQVPSFAGAPWPYQWNSAQWPPPVPPPGFCPPGFPMPVFWSYPVPTGPWSFPWIPRPGSPSTAASNSGPNSPALGKHSREESMGKSDDSGADEPVKEKSDSSERSLWVPKTLRLDDPGEAAKSSIWETLGIKNENLDSVSGGGLFKGFQQKGEEKNNAAQTSRVLQANPAALSRSIKFHETSLLQN